MRGGSARARVLAASVAVIGATLLGPVGGATATSFAGDREAAADPITGIWLFASKYADLSAKPQHTVTATVSGFDIVANEPYRAGAPAGVTFSVLERAAAHDDNPQCAVNPGTIVGRFRYTGTDAKFGNRLYEGQMLTAQVSSGRPATCSLLGLRGSYYAFLMRWADLAQKPPLLDGPYNRLCVNDGPGTSSCYVNFDRKGGTPVPTAATTPTTTTVPKAPVTGLVPRNPKIPPDARFKDDRTPPAVQAVASKGRRGSPFFLDYYSKDDRGFAGETYAIYRGKKLLKTWRVLAGERDGRLQRAPSTLPASISGRLIFCVGAQDLNGNRSRWSCAPLTIT